MKRRQAIHSFFYLTLAGTTLLSCKNEKEAWTKLDLQKLQLSRHHFELFQHLAKALLPIHSLPGWEKISLPPMAAQLIDHCYSIEDITKFKEGLEQVDKTARLQYHMPFLSCNQKDIVSMINKWNAEEQNNSPESFTMAVLKKEMLHSFTTTKRYLKQYKMYEMIPARFTACAKIETINAHRQ
ncbi:MAG: gluconate 2-dehydrogenase subunit 3 family protein [Saprospiraceae bacterium]|nr:gluconate 2-dehydrogenase subunit 3 family protein [Saprospiraceae bacterium]